MSGSVHCQGDGFVAHRDGFPVDHRHERAKGGFGLYRLGRCHRVGHRGPLNEVGPGAAILRPGQAATDIAGLCLERGGCVLSVGEKGGVGGARDQSKLTISITGLSAAVVSARAASAGAISRVGARAVRGCIGVSISCDGGLPTSCLG